MVTLILFKWFYITYVTLAINPEFKDAVKLFYLRSGIKIDYPIEFNTATFGWLAYCDFKEKRRIIINPVEWKKYSKVAKEQVLLHEFGHCSLNRDHYSALNAEGQPVSIMNDNDMIDDEYYLKNKEYYLSELVNSTEVRD